MSTPIRILMVEDSPGDAELIERELRRGGVSLTASRVWSEETLRQQLAEQAPDIILADFSLPGFSGWSALMIAREVAPDTPFLFVSGSIGEERAIEALHNGAADYILKDRLSRLPSAVRRAIADREKQRQEKRLERQLEQERQVNSLGRIAAIIAHEFNNVLMGIQPFAEIIQRRSDDDPKRAKAAEQILSAVSRGRTITQDILRAANPGEPSPQVINLTTWLEDIAAQIRMMVDRKVALSVELPDQPVHVRCDPHQMHQVLINLALNARDAMAQGGQLRISMSAETATNSSPPIARISVQDTGAGIPAEVLPQIFEPFFTTKKHGTGLGLAVGRQMVLRNSGEMSVSSTVGSGTTFSILLPTIASETVTAQRKAPAVLRILNKLLIADDDDVVVAGMKAILEMEGFEVHVVTRAVEVLPAVSDFRPDAVILDLTLADGNGADVYRALAASWPALPVIIATGHFDPAVHVGLAGNARLAFLTKPFDVAALLEKLAALA